MPESSNTGGYLDSKCTLNTATFGAYAAAGRARLSGLLSMNELPPVSDLYGKRKGQVG